MFAAAVPSKPCCSPCGARRAWEEHYAAGRHAAGFGETPLDVPWTPLGVGPGGVGLAGMFAWKPERGEKVLAAFAAAKGLPVTMTADDFRQGLITALFHAEELAVKAGLAVTIPIAEGVPTPEGDPRQGYMLGAGYAKAKAHPENPASAQYLSVYTAVQAALSASKAAGDHAPLTLPVPGDPPVAAQPAVFAPPMPMDPADLLSNVESVAPLLTWAAGLAPVVAILIGVIALAALAASAYLLVHTVQASSDAIARVARCAQAASLARDGKPIPPGLCPPEPIRPSPSLGGLGSFSFGAGSGLALAAAAGAAFLFLRKG